jgi:hypothetical protein
LQFWEYLFNTFPFSDYNLVKRVRAAELTDVGEVKISGKPLSLEEKQQMAFDQMEKQAQPQGSQDKPGNPAFEDKFQKEDVFPTQKGEQWLVQERGPKIQSTKSANGTHNAITKEKRHRPRYSLNY